MRLILMVLERIVKTGAYIRVKHSPHTYLDLLGMMEMVFLDDTD